MEKNFIYIFLNEEKRDLYFYEYLSICSLFHTQNVLQLFIYSYNQLSGYYIQLLKQFHQIQYKSILLIYFQPGHKMIMGILIPTTRYLM